METRAIDLHAHTCKSDGSLTPTELVDLAIEKNLAALAVTDHDTTDGIDEAMSAAQKYDNFELIPGIEFSTDYHGGDVHIVGLYVDHKSASFEEYVQDFRNQREDRNEKMCKRLQEHGVNIEYSELKAEFPGSVLTRAHYARFIVQKGYCTSMREVFDRYIGDHAPCYVLREKITPEKAVRLILKCGGVPVLAHPILYHLSDAKLDELVGLLKKEGLAAIEAVYCTYNSAEERQIKALANKYDLLLSGGSDFHGAAKPNLELGTGYGKLFVPYEFLAKIKEFNINSKL